MLSFTNKLALVSDFTEYLFLQNNFNFRNYISISEKNSLSDEIIIYLFQISI